MDILSERGFRCRFDEKTVFVPDHLDSDRHRIVCRPEQCFYFYIEFPSASLMRA